MYIDAKLAKTVFGLIMDVYGSALKFPDGNMEYVIRKDECSDKYELVIHKIDRSTHEVVWLNMEKLITEIHQNARAKTEKILLAAIKGVIDLQGATFPSALRDEVNYQLQYGVLAITKNVQLTNACKEYTGNWLGELLSSTSKEKNPAY